MASIVKEVLGSAQKLLPNAEESLVRKFMQEGMSAEDALAKAKLMNADTSGQLANTVIQKEAPVFDDSPIGNTATIPTDKGTTLLGDITPAVEPPAPSIAPSKLMTKRNTAAAAGVGAIAAGTAAALLPSETAGSNTTSQGVSTKGSPELGMLANVPQRALAELRSGTNAVPAPETIPAAPKAAMPTAASVTAPESDTARNTLDNLPAMPDPLGASKNTVNELGVVTDKIEQQKPGMGEVVKSGYEQMLAELKDAIGDLTAQQAAATDEHKKALTAARIGEAVSIFAHALNKYAAASEGVSKKLNVAQYYDAKPADFKPTYDAINADFAEKMQGIRTGVEAVTKQQRDVMKQKAKADEIKAGQDFEMGKLGQQFANEKEMQGIKTAEAQRSEGFKAALETKITGMKIKSDADLQAARAKSDKERDAINNAAKEKLAGLEHSYKTQEAKLSKAEKDDLKLAEMEEKNIAEQRASISAARNALNNPALKGDARSNMIAEYATRLGVPVIRKSAIFGEGDVDPVATLAAADKAFDAMPTMGSQLKARLANAPTAEQSSVVQPQAVATPAPAAAPNVDQGKAQTAAANALKSAPMGATLPVTVNGVTYKFKKTGENSVIIVQ